MATTTKRRPRSAIHPSGKNKTTSHTPAEFPSGSLESDLSAIGQAVPAAEWANVPADYFANLDGYLHGSPNKK